MDEISEDVLDALHIVAATLIGEKVENGNTSLSVDYENEVIIFNDFNHSITFRINCCGDSERGAVIDVVKHLFNKFI